MNDSHSPEMFQTNFKNLFTILFTYYNALAQSIHEEYSLNKKVTRDWWWMPGVYSFCSPCVKVRCDHFEISYHNWWHDTLRFSIKSCSPLVNFQGGRELTSSRDTNLLLLILTVTIPCFVIAIMPDEKLQCRHHYLSLDTNGNILYWMLYRETKLEIVCTTKMPPPTRFSQRFKWFFLLIVSLLQWPWTWAQNYIVWKLNFSRYIVHWFWSHWSNVIKLGQ